MPLSQRNFRVMLTALKSEQAICDFFLNTNDRPYVCLVLTTIFTGIPSWRYLWCFYGDQMSTNFLNMLLLKKKIMNWELTDMCRNVSNARIFSLISVTNCPIVACERSRISRGRFPEIHCMSAFAGLSPSCSPQNQRHSCVGIQTITCNVTKWSSSLDK